MREQQWLLIETSGRPGAVGVAAAAIIAERALDDQRRHAQDLIPAAADLLREVGWAPTDVTNVAVSLGPGSYTGLRVGVMAAKAFAYATGCGLVAVPTFEAIAERSTLPVERLDVIADALKGMLYAQTFVRESGDRWRAGSELTIEARDTWLARLPADAGVTGPGISTIDRWPANVQVAPPRERAPRLPALLSVARRHTPLTREALLALEPIYLRPSSAEQQWQSADRQA